MAIHSASRLGVLRYVYQQRQAIAFTLGLSDESPIAVCSSHYHIDHELVVADDLAPEHTPAVLSLAQQIDLFPASPLMDLPALPVIDFRKTNGEPVSPYTYNPTRSIFRPPLV